MLFHRGADRLAGQEETHCVPVRALVLGQNRRRFVGAEFKIRVGP